MPAIKDLTGLQFGRWTVIRRDVDRVKGRPRWLCRCNCGNEGVVPAQALVAGKSKSCGCYNSELRRAICLKRATHGQSDSSLHVAWVNMIQRCHNPKASGFRKYGGKGIKVCQRWRNSFIAFRDDLGDKPAPHHTIDRIDPRGDYEPGNVRWLDMQGQQNNRTNNRLIAFQGRTMTLQQWARATGLHREVIATRLDKLGWSVEKALTKQADKTAGRFRPKIATTAD